MTRHSTSSTQRAIERLVRKTPKAARGIHAGEVASILRDCEDTDLTAVLTYLKAAFMTDQLEYHLVAYGSKTAELYYSTVGDMLSAHEESPVRLDLRVGTTFVAMYDVPPTWLRSAKRLLRDLVLRDAYTQEAMAPLMSGHRYEEYKAAALEDADSNPAAYDLLLAEYVAGWELRARPEHENADLALHGTILAAMVGGVSDARRCLVELLLRKHEKERLARAEIDAADAALTRMTVREAVKYSEDIRRAT